MEHMYYGRAPLKTVKKGVYYFMFEEAMNQRLSVCLETLTKETNKIHNQHKAEIQKLIAETKQLNDRFGALLKLFEKDELKDVIKKSKENKETKTS